MNLKPIITAFNITILSETSELYLYRRDYNFMQQRPLLFTKKRVCGLLQKKRKF